MMFGGTATVMARYPWPSIVDLGSQVAGRLFHVTLFIGAGTPSNW
jgi:hypothetical protein